MKSNNFAAIQLAVVRKFFTVSVFATLLLGSIVLSPVQRALALSNGGIIAATNAERAAAGLPALSANGLLNSSAALKAQDMCTKGYWAHTSPDGLTAWTFMNRVGYAYIIAGENLARGYSSDSAVVAGWMSSATHRANILYPTYTEIGVAAVSCNFQGEQTVLAVAHYGSRGAVATPPPSQQPAKAPAPTAKTQPTSQNSLPQPVASTPSPATSEPTQVSELPKKHTGPTLLEIAQKYDGSFLDHLVVEKVIRA